MLIKILKTSICGTDVHIWNWDAWAQKTIPVPMIVGHEFVGRIEAVGEQRARFPPGRSGQRRGAPGLRPLPQLPGRPAASLPRHQRRGRQPRRRLRRVPVDPGDQRLGVRSEDSAWRSSAVSTRSATPRTRRCSFDVLGEDVLITGAGPIGIMAAAIARHAGARYVVITDVNPYRLELAKKMGATLALDVRTRAASPTRRRNWA